MRIKGISYSTGAFTPGPTDEPFEPERARRDLQVIREELHCNAVRIIGADPERLKITAELAAEVGLEIWYCPFPIDHDAEEMLSLMRHCASHAENLRLQGARVVFVTGAELTLLAKGFLPGDQLDARMSLLGSPENRAKLREHWSEAGRRLHHFLSQAVSEVRQFFSGPVTYASLPSERVDWSGFDILGTDAYLSAEITDIYADAIRLLVAQGMPVVITEFGCGTFRGAGAQGARGVFMIERKSAMRARLKGEYERDEQEQVEYARKSLEIFEAAGVEGAFWCLFADYTLPHRPDHQQDLDLASYGVVKVTEGAYGSDGHERPWRPKAVFQALADAYATGS